MRWTGGLVVLGGAALVVILGAFALTWHGASGGGRSAGSRPPGPIGASEVGPLYYAAQSQKHHCTASVVDSRREDLLITAAHCLSGNGVGMTFAPGQHGAVRPYGLWTVNAAYVDPKWVEGQDPHDDVAFLVVAPRTIDGRRLNIEQVTGAYPLGLSGRAGERVTVVGYPAGGFNDPIRCNAKVYLYHGFPAFDCRGFVDGTSGSPWLWSGPHGVVIVGVIGGPKQGGCVDSTSYSSPLASDAATTYSRAATNASADTVPAPNASGC